MRNEITRSVDPIPIVVADAVDAQVDTERDGRGQFRQREGPLSREKPKPSDGLEPIIDVSEDDILLDEGFSFAEADRRELKGFASPVRVYELLGRQGETPRAGTERPSKDVSRLPGSLLSGARRLLGGRSA